MPNPFNQALQDIIQRDVNTLKGNPSDTTLRTKILKNQVALTGSQLGIDGKEAGNVIKAYTAAYAVTQKIDPNQLLQTLTKEEQNIINYSASNPTLYGVSLTTANQIAGYLGLGSGVLLTAAIAVFAVALFTIGPEAAATIAAGEGVVATIGSLVGSPLIATGGFLFLLSQFLGHLSSGIPMMTKQLIDNGSIGPGLRITALKQAEELQQKAQGTDSPGPFTSAQFSDYTKAIESAGIASIKDPKTGSIVPYSRAVLAQAIIYLYGQEIVHGAKSTYTSVKTALSPYLLTTKSTGSTAAPGSSSSAASSGSGSKGTTTVSVAKVFTGIVSSGVVSSDLSFTPRPDDLIESVEELKTAASNNLAPYLAALPGKIVYEVKIVSSIVTKDGFKQTGTTQKIQTGTYQNGLPKYKTVTNKFATLILYAITDKGSRAKLATIVLGPTDSTKLTVTQNDISAIETQLPALVTTTNINDITGIKTNVPITTVPVDVPGVQNVPMATSAQVDTDPTHKFDKYTGKLNPYYVAPTTPAVYNKAPESITIADLMAAGFTAEQANRLIGGDNHDNGPNYVAHYGGLQNAADALHYTPAVINTPVSAPSTINTAGAYQIEKSNTPSGTELIYYPPGTPVNTALKAPGAPAASSTIPTASIIGPVKNGSTATTLSAWYTANGQALPSVSARAATYQSLGLGQASFYTGTAEQNTKLLAALKAK